ncbi:MAG TPA: hypothetical protein VKT77_19865 [Chthonomonadaceae bacterium]|nr:hypothetical protein [Chthonomonadaceae bacterium]
MSGKNIRLFLAVAICTACLYLTTGCPSGRGSSGGGSQPQPPYAGTAQNRVPTR